jgi:endonuclease-3
MGGRTAGRKPPVSLVKKAEAVGRLLAEHHADADIALNFSNPLELLVATVLSAQCTDIRVNLVTPALFARYRTAADYAGADLETLMEEIRSTGFFRNKAKSIIGAARRIEERHGGKVPASLDELVTLPGIGRKTANVILGNAFDTPGVVVDTHVRRVSRRLGLTKNDDPVKIEFDLMRLFPPRDWTFLSHRLIFHGRRICGARRPRCVDCFFDESLCSARRDLLGKAPPAGDTRAGIS